MRVKRNCGRLNFTNCTKKLIYKILTYFDSIMREFYNFQFKTARRLFVLKQTSKLSNLCKNDNEKRSKGEAKSR